MAALDRNRKHGHTLKLEPVSLPGVPHRPTAKQFLALNLYGREVMYGGAAGGGKSDFLLMAATQYVHVPGYNALILRRTWPQLAAPESGLLARAMSWFESDTRYHGRKSVDGYPTVWEYEGGGTISFGHMQHLKDRTNYQGPDFQFVGWDEATQFVRAMYLYLFSRLRRPDSGPLSLVPLRIRAASNPGGEGHDWVRERFVKSPNTASNVFVPSKLTDNPHLDQVEYRHSLAELPEHERLMLEHGDWDAAPPGAFFKRENFPIIDSAPERMEEVRFWDLAATEARPGKDPDSTAGVRMGRVGVGSYVISDVQCGRWGEDRTESRVLHTAQVDGRTVSVHMEQEPGASGKLVVHAFRKKLEGTPFKASPSTGSKYVRAKAFIASTERAEVALVRGEWNEPFLRSLERTTYNNTDHDDEADAAAGAWNALTMRRGVSPGDLYGEGVAA